MQRLDEAGRPVGDPIDVPADNVTLTATTEPEIAVGDHVLVAPNATTRGGGGVYFRWDGDAPIPGTVESISDTTVQVRAQGQRGGQTAQYVARRFVTRDRRQSIRLGDLFVVTSRDGGHGIPIGTVVKVARQSGREDYLTDRTIFVTRHLDGPVEDVPHSIGESAWGFRPTSGTPSFQPISQVDTVTASRVRDITRDSVQIGDLLRITSTHDGHGFPIGTLVRVCERDGRRGFMSRDYGDDRYVRVFVTSSIDETPEQLAEPHQWSYGRGAWVVLRDDNRSHCDVNAEYAEPPEPEPEAVSYEAALAAAEAALADVEDEAEKQRLTTLLDDLRGAHAARMEAQQERASWLERLIERSREVAEEQDWCGVYDSGMRELGLPDRSSMPERQREVTAYADIEVEVGFDEDHFEEWFRARYDAFDFDSIDSNSVTFTVNLSVSTEVTVSADDCGCEAEVDWEDHLPSWVRDNGFSWDVTNRSCEDD